MPPKRPGPHKRPAPAVEQNPHDSRTAVRDSDSSAADDDDRSSDLAAASDDDDEAAFQGYDEEVVINENEGEDLQIANDEVDTILAQALTDLSIQDRQQRQEKKDLERVYVPGDPIGDDEVSLLHIIVTVTPSDYPSC
jgi:hypothetical protein